MSHTAFRPRHPLIYRLRFSKYSLSLLARSSALNTLTRSRNAARCLLLCRISPPYLHHDHP
jgi:hypothetical protein